MNAQPARFLELFREFENLPDKEREQEVENNSGELYIVCNFWEECRATPDTLEYDPCDAGYIFMALVAFDEVKYMRAAGRTAMDHATMLQLWELALTSAIALMSVVDFNDGEYDFGVFCYEHLGSEPGELVDQIYNEIYQMHGTDVEAVVRRYAEAKGWPLL